MQHFNVNGRNPLLIVGMDESSPHPIIQVYKHKEEMLPYKNKFFVSKKERYDYEQL